jgi:four helix bundle protein
MEPHFDHEKLRVYQEAIAFVAWCEEILTKCSARAAVKDQLDRASTSIPLNIAEGNGKYPGRDRCRYLEIARGSALECAACLDVLVAKGRLNIEDIKLGKTKLHGIVSMLTGLLGSVSDRMRENRDVYGEERGNYE